MKFFFNAPALMPQYHKWYAKRQELGTLKVLVRGAYGRPPGKFRHMDPSRQPM